MSGHVIFLHGPSSSGKSTLAKALQSRIDKPFLHLSIDHLRDAGVLPDAGLASGSFHWSDMRMAVFDGFHRSLPAFLVAGNNVIVEHILDNPGWCCELKRLLRPFDVLFVGVYCDLDELCRREQVRGDRPLGSAKQDYQTVHAGRCYDLEIDNSGDRLSQNVDDILHAWRSGTRVSEFAT
ncbi:AAA family ATPase [Phaeobacter sp.]|uniref:chloramphenicol phosphotransferase CPT family protein n=1 Tax=Phaeobacter sp. TaxID=1902409 RepID=UPI0025CF235D|nr:AAA family ATPase [Phaeobacter sp.]